MCNLAVLKRNFELRETGSRERILKVLEPDAGKFARPVLKGESHGNVTFLPTDIIAYVKSTWSVTYSVPGMRNFFSVYSWHTSKKRPAFSYET